MLHAFTVMIFILWWWGWCQEFRVDFVYLAVYVSYTSVGLPKKKDCFIVNLCFQYLWNVELIGLAILSKLGVFLQKMFCKKWRLKSDFAIIYRTIMLFWNTMSWCISVIIIQHTHSRVFFIPDFTNGSHPVSSDFVKFSIIGSHKGFKGLH